MLSFPDDFIEELKSAHENMINFIPAKQPYDFYHGSGYVFVGGGIYTWYSLLNIQVIRSIGSTLPVEVIIPTDEEYEEEPCEELLPKFNAKCVRLSTVFGSESMEKLDIGGYQYKALALIASSFDNTFLIDADSFPVLNPDLLFESDVYQKTGMITWPDYWHI
ncbi:unnamed protein product [Ambrosiozyma monospora]|uniref:Unnamed protein product n=1 Tax=Ambrosiozyma monospora TaxID=43982 RepID=A0ACB5UDI9_AMBMO|nr:unnamed protein product [Ambrosiozyma monospora]